MIDLKVDDKYNVSISKWILYSFNVFVSYFITGWIGLQIPYVGTQITLIWFPSGIAVISILLLGYRIIPSIFMAAFLVNYYISSSLSVSAGIAISNTLRPLLTVYLLRYFQFDNNFNRGRDIPILWHLQL